MFDFRIISLDFCEIDSIIDTMFLCLCVGDECCG